MQRSRASPRRAASPQPQRPAARRVALIGSSGGSTLRSTVGGEVEHLQAQLAEIALDGRVALAALLFVEASCPLDHANSHAPAALWQLGDDGEPVCEMRGTLEEVNRAAKRLDARLSRRVSAGGLDALMLVSAHFGANGVNAATLAAAVKARVPLLGTGGTSLGQAVAAGGLLLQLSGSVATTAESRSIAAAAALARHWRLGYSPRWPAAETQFLPVLDATLPAVLTLSLLHRLAIASAPEVLSLVPHLASRVALPTTLAALVARRSAQLGDSGAIAGSIAGAVTAVVGLLWAEAFPGAAITATALAPTTTTPSTAEGGAGGAALVAGLIAGLVARRALAASHRLGLPATASTLFTVGAAGTVGALVGGLLAPCYGVLASAVRSHLAALTSPNLPLPVRLGVGAASGLLTKWGSIHGFYHCVMMPLIMLEMEVGGFALLGAFDACCLCCVCAGVCAAVAVTTARTAPAEAAASRRAVRINLLLGDYVEACYPCAYALSSRMHMHMSMSMSMPMSMCTSMSMHMARAHAANAAYANA